MTHSAAANSYEVNADHVTTPTHVLCRVIRMEEVNAGDSYTLEVDLFTVIGNGKVNYGHPGVMYNVADGNNFDFVYFRFVHFCLQVIQEGLTDFCSKRAYNFVLKMGNCFYNFQSISFIFIICYKYHPNK